MASYLDQPYQFAPFVQTVPVESMVKVGMMRQQQYDAGVEKVRQYAETLSGLNVSNHPGIIQYLNKSMENLKSELKPLAGADFSDQQLVNSVGALARQIYKDPIIQNGVRSAARIKENYELMDQSIKDGKSSPDNEADFYGTLNDWYNNPDLAKPFSGRYYSYTDYSKKWLEAVSKLTPDETIRQIPFTTFVDPETGRVLQGDKLAAVMTEVGVKGLTPEKVENALRATMTPDIMNQLRIESRVRFKDVPTEKLLGVAKEQYESQRLAYETEKEKLEKELPTLISKPKEYAFVRQRIADLGVKLADVNNPKSLIYALEQQLKDIKEDPEAAKRRIYTDGAIAQFAQAFQSKSVSVKYLDSPYQKFFMEQAKLDLDIKRFQLSLAQFDFEKMYKNALIQIKMAGLDDGSGGDGDGEGGGGGGIGLGRPSIVPTTLGFPEDTDWPAYHALAETNYINARNSTFQKLMKGMSGLTENQVLEKLTLYRYGNAETKGVGKRDEIPVPLRSLADSFWSNTEQAGKINLALHKYERSARTKLGDLAPFTVEGPNGTTINFTPSEMRSLRSKVNLVTLPGGNRLAGPMFEPKQGAQLTEKEKAIVQSSPSVRNNIASYFGEIEVNNEAVNKEMSKQMSAFGTTFEPQSTLIPTFTEKARNNMVAIAQQLAMAPGPEGGSPLSKGGKPLSGNTIPSDFVPDKNTAFFLVDVGPTKRLVVAKNFQEQFSIDIGPITMARHPVLSMYNRDPFEFDAAMNMALGEGRSQGLFPPTSFKNVKKLNVRGELEKDGSGTTNYLTLHVEVPGLGDYPITYERPLDALEARNYVNTITDNGLLKDIKTFSSTTPDVLQVLEAIINAK